MADACARRDWQLAVGSAKDLAESVAKIVLDVRGETYGNAISFPTSRDRSSEPVTADRVIAERSRRSNAESSKPVVRFRAAL